MSKSMQDFGANNVETQSQRLQSNTVQDFFKIEQENESLRDNILEV